MPEDATNTKEIPAKPFNPAAKKKLKLLDRQNMALEMRKAGASYRVIARELRKAPGVSANYSEGAAYGDIMTALKRLMDDQKELAQENLRLDMERLDIMFQRLWKKAIPTKAPGAVVDPPYDPMAISLVMQIMDKRATLLNYKALMTVPTTNLNIDLDSLTDAQLQRIANGEDPIIVIATSGTSGSQTPSAN